MKTHIHYSFCYIFEKHFRNFKRYLCLLFRVLAWEDGFCDILKQSPIEDLYFDNSNNIVSSNLMSSMCDGTPSHYLVGLAVAEMSNASHVVGKG